MTTQDTTKTNTFSPATPSLDPSKHVNYLLGMVLGVDDFNQEFAYLSNRDQWLARDLLGYGTFCGLDVSYEKKDKDGKAVNNLQVEPGAALSPSGKFIKVNFTQCADIQKWLEDKNTQAGIVNATKKAKKAALDVALAAKAASKAPLSKKAKDALAKLELAAAKEDVIGDSIKLYLTLCYRDCLTDLVQIAGEACRTETGDDNSLLKPSRIQNDFSLNLSFEQKELPDQTEENALREFAAWLREFKVAASGSLTPDDFAQAISDAIKKQMKIDKQRPMDFVNQMSKSITFASAELSEFLRAAFRVWTTELRPLVRGANADCVNPSQVDCVLLAELDVTLAGDWGVKAVTIDEERRPYLLHLRMLQEWMLQNSHFPGDTVVDEKGWGQPSTAGTSQLFSRVDHTHGTPDLDGDVVVDKSIDNPTKNIIARLQKKLVNAPNPTIGQVLTFAPSETEAGEWQANDLPELAGEVTGPISDTRVAEILDVAVAEKLLDAPHPGQVLTLTGEDPQWQAMDLPPIELTGEVTGPVNNTHVSKILDLEVAMPAPPDGPQPQDGQVLTLVKTEGALQWQAMDLPDLVPPVVLGGDVTGPAATNQIDMLQGNKVDAPKPEPGQVLTFVQGNPDAETETGKQDHWEPVHPQPASVDGFFVTRPSTAGEYGIVAAGVCSFKLVDGKNGTASMNSSYNNLKLVDTNVLDSQLSFTYNEYNKAKQKPPFHHYIVKLTPWQTGQTPFVTYFIDFFVGHFRIGFSPLGQFDQKFDGSIMIEVSQFTPDGRG